MSQTKLPKPVFITIDKISKGKSGYNIYAKVLEAEVHYKDTKDGQKIKMVNAVIADETAAAKAFFKGENASIINIGNIIAIRNGVKQIINGHICLKVDIFGRVTAEEKEIKEKIDLNISDEQFKQELNRRQKKKNQRDHRNFNNQVVKKNRDRKNKINKRGQNNHIRKNNQSFNGENKRDDNRHQNRSNRPNKNDLDYDRNRGSKQNFKNNGYGHYNRNGRNSPDYRSNNYHAIKYQEKKPKTIQYQQKKQNKQPLIKINEIDPGINDLSFTAKVIEVTIIKGRNNNSLKCILGDETGIVNAFMPENDHLIKGRTVTIFNCQSKVVNEHIQIQRGKIKEEKKSISMVNEKQNMSFKAWVPID